jgi:hypothetical protein
MPKDESNCLVAYLHNEYNHHQRILLLSQLDTHKLFHGKYPAYSPNNYYMHKLKRKIYLISQIFKKNLTPQKYLACSDVSSLILPAATIVL